MCRIQAHNYDDYHDNRMLSEHNHSLVATGPDGSIRSFPGVISRRWLTTVVGESELASEAFCCEYTSLGEEESMRRGHYQPTTSFLCVAASEDTSHGFRNITFGLMDKHNVRKNKVLRFVKAFNGELWLAALVYDEGRYLGKEIYKHPGTMHLTSIANVTQNNENESREYDTDKCAHWTAIIGSLVVAAVVGPASFWMLKVRKMPAGVVPVCFITFSILGKLSADDLAQSIAFLVVVALTISLFGTPLAWVSREC
jgi:hypothetical protein